MRRRQFLRTLGAAGAGCVLARMEWAVAGEAGPLKIVFYTDVHCMPGLTDEKVLFRAAEMIAGEGADVLIAGGDVIHRGHHSPGAECRERFALYRAFLDRLPGPVWHVPGNHDLAGARPEDGSPPAADPWRLWRGELGVGRPCQTFDSHGVRFLILDTLVVDREDPALYRGEAGAERLGWLRAVLRDTPRGQPLILCTHIPLASNFLLSKHGGSPPPPGLQTVDARQILEAFHGHHLLAVLQGHLHVREESRAGALPLITAGAVSGAWWRGANEGTPPGYARVEIGSGKLLWQYVAVA